MAFLHKAFAISTLFAFVKITWSSFKWSTNASSKKSIGNTKKFGQLSNGFDFETSDCDAIVFWSWKLLWISFEDGLLEIEPSSFGSHDWVCCWSVAIWELILSSPVVWLYFNEILLRNDSYWIIRNGEDNCWWMASLGAYLINEPVSFNS